MTLTLHFPPWLGPFAIGFACGCVFAAFLCVVVLAHQFDGIQV